MAVAAETMLSPIPWELWSALTLRVMASQSLPHPGYGTSGHGDADRPESLEKKCLLFLVAFLMRFLKGVAPGTMYSRLWAGKVLFLLG